MHHPAQTSAAATPWPVCPGCEHCNVASDWSNTEHRCIECGNQWIETPPADHRATVTLREPGARRPRVDTLDLCRLVRSINRQEAPVERAAWGLAEGLARAADALESQGDVLALATLGLAREADGYDLTEAEFLALARRAYQFARWHRAEVGPPEAETVAAFGILKAQQAAQP